MFDWHGIGIASPDKWHEKTIVPARMKGAWPMSSTLAIPYPMTNTATAVAAIAIAIAAAATSAGTGTMTNYERLPSMLSSSPWVVSASLIIPILIVQSFQILQCWIQPSPIHWRHPYHQLPPLVLQRPPRNIESRPKGYQQDGKNSLLYTYCASAWAFAIKPLWRI